MTRKIGVGGLVAAGGALFLSGCGGNYTWGWYVVSPTTRQGRTNLEFLLSGLLNTVSISLISIALSVLIGLIVALSPRLVKDWERAVLLRLGKFSSVLQPGISWIIPGLDVVSATVDMRIRSTSFSAEKTLTADTVPVNRRLRTWAKARHSGCGNWSTTSAPVNNAHGC